MSVIDTVFKFAGHTYHLYPLQAIIICYYLRLALTCAQSVYLVVLYNTLHNTYLQMPEISPFGHAIVPWISVHGHLNITSILACMGAYMGYTFL